MIVLDTNVLSELSKLNPDEAVMTWVSTQRRAELCTTAVNEAELAFGLALLPKGKRRSELTQALTRLLNEGLDGQVLAFGREAALAYGEIAARRRAAGRPISTADGQIAAIARVHGVKLIATRDVGGFVGCGLTITNPWMVSDLT